MTLPEKLIAARRKADLSQAELADKLGLCSRTILNYEQGKQLTGIKVQTMIAYAGELPDLTVKDFLEGIADES